MRKVFTLLSAILLTTFSSMSLSAQNCGTATRTAVDCKFGTPDAVGWAMQQFFNDGSTATWNFESGATFVENADGTACLKGVITQYGSSPARSFNVVVNFTGKSTTTTGTPETNNLCPPGSTASWQYYTLSSGSLTGVAGTAAAGAQLTLTQHMMPSQYGIGGANQCSETNNLGMTGWFEYQVVSQPSNGWLKIMPYSSAPVVGQADFCIRLSGTPTTCGGGGNPCDTDVTPPVFANCPANIVKTPTVSGSCWTISWTAPTATDNCCTPTVTQTAGPANGSCLAPGSYTVTYTATDLKGNKAYCTFTITVNPFNTCDNDVTPPVFVNCPANIVKTPTVSGSCWTISWTAPTATDNCCTPSVVQTAGPANGSCLAPGSYTVTYTATDLKGNKAYCTFTITVIPYNPCGSDVTAPVFTNCPTNISVTTTSNCAVVTYSTPTATDNCSTPTVVQTAGFGSGYCFVIGTTTNTFTATDAKGNKAYCTFTVTVTKTPPICLQPATPYGYTFIGQYGNNFYYKYNGDDEKYSESKKRCEGYGGHLAYCKESGEGDFLKKYKYGKKMWLGLEYDGYNWYCGDGSKENNYNWGYGEPKKDDKDKKYCKVDDDGKWYACKDDEKGGAILVLPCATTPPPTCIQPNTPYGYTFIGQYGNNFYYKYNGDDEKYSESKKRCEGYGGHLAYCKEGGEGDFLKKYKYGKKMWLGLEYDGYNWYCGDGSKENFYSWGYDEPKKDDKDKKYCKKDDDGKWYASKDDEKGGAILVLPCVGTPSPVCNANFDEKKYYKIVNKKSGKCLDVEGAKKDKYAAVEQYDYYGGDNQKWYIIPTSDGYCKMYAKHSGKILSCNSSWNGSQLYQDEDKKDKDKENANGEKEWKIECDKDGYKITHRMSGRSCHEGYNIYNGSHCQLWDWNSGDEERFDLVDVTNDQSGQHLQNTRVLSISASVEANKTRIEWVNNTGATNDFFQVEKLNATTGNFEAIINVPSLNTTTMESYVSYDVKPTEGDNFYRINAISLDGTSTISDIQKVNFKGLAGNLSIFPNPADEVLNIDLTNYKGKAVSLFVYNHLGQAVITQQIDNVTDGLIQVDVSNQHMGNYLVRIASKGKRDETKSFILNK